MSNDSIEVPPPIPYPSLELPREEFRGELTRVSAVDGKVYPIGGLQPGSEKKAAEKIITRKVTDAVFMLDLVCPWFLNGTPVVGCNTYTSRFGVLLVFVIGMVYALGICSVEESQSRFADSVSV